MTELTQEQWREGSRSDRNAAILDVRTPMEWEGGIIPGATRMDVMDGANFLEKIKTLDKDMTYYVYCKSGARSAHACMLMESKGFGETYNLRGGISSWNGEIES